MVADYTVSLRDYDTDSSCLLTKPEPINKESDSPSQSDPPVNRRAQYWLSE